MKWMPHGRRVRVEPKVYFSELSSVAPRLRRPPSHALGPFSVLGVKESQQKETKAAAAAASSTVAALAGVSASKGVVGKGNKQAPASKNGGDGGGGAATAAGGDTTTANDTVAGAGEGEDDSKVKTDFREKCRPSVCCVMLDTFPRYHKCQPVNTKRL